ncbi:hypothetical protein CENSYa_1475 [Cenarchaeum symbiosum A]|uniref:Uncharacterized protein n=1 Tax=Cenarchaeum symbiosum (strain A) TaxID=414004 RepID=A0RXN0_CENSY|nr:hypothetical protein CENSYa_1475 [Cenarchaeum symbiosum A]
MPLRTMALSGAASGRLRRRITVRRAVILVSCIAAVAVSAHMLTEVRCYHPPDAAFTRMICNDFDDLNEVERGVLAGMNVNAFGDNKRLTREDVRICTEIPQKCAHGWQHLVDILSGRPLGTNGFPDPIRSEPGRGLPPPPGCPDVRNCYGQPDGGYGPKHIGPVKR